MQQQIVSGPTLITAHLPDDTAIISPGFSLPLPVTDDLAATAAHSIDAPLDRAPLSQQVKAGMKVTIAFDDPTVPCYAPVWATTIPLIIDRLEKGGVAARDISLICANSLHRQFTMDELAKVLGEGLIREHRDRISCHDAEDPGQMVLVGRTNTGLHVQLGRSVTESDLTIYLNCSTMRGFSGGWKSVCVGLSGYTSIHHHHTPDVMSMSLDRNRMHEMLDEMGAVVDEKLGRDRVFKIETVLANPLGVNDMYGGSVAETRRAVIDKLRAHQPARRDLIEEPADIVIYGVPDWSPYAAFSHTNPILDMVSTGLGYLGGMIQAVGRKGCTVILVTPCPERWNMTHHPAYKEVWEEVVRPGIDPDVLRRDVEPDLAARDDLIQAYRFRNAFHPVHATMALYPLKRLRHAADVIVAGAEHPHVPERLGFTSTVTVEAALQEARSRQGADAKVAFIDYPMAFNRA